MADLPKGFTIKTKSFKDVVVTGDKLGEGGFGAVYPVDYDSDRKSKVMKWFSGNKFKNPEKFYANLESNIKKGKPSNNFVWPEDITNYMGDSFGYIMDRFPSGYKEFSKFLLGKERFAGLTPMVNTSLLITSGFRELHLKGYSYQDLNDGNFVINPQNGDVLIIDNDNVSGDSKITGIAGKSRYVAPEIVAKGAKPSTNTDKFSLALILFLLWVRNHPLEGKAACPPCLNAKHERIIYGENPVFIWDPDDNSNRPVQGIHIGAITQWPLLPVYLQEEFKKAFSKDLLANPGNRILDQEWLRLFIRMRAEIYKCPCGEVYFADPVNPNPCPGCKKQNAFPFYIKTYRYNVPVHQRTMLYTCHTEKDSDDFKNITGEVSAKGNEYELKNVSDKNWTVTDGDNTSSVARSASFILKKGMVINFGQASAEII